MDMDNRMLENLLDIARKNPDHDVLETLFTIIAEDAYFLCVMNFSKKPTMMKDGHVMVHPDTTVYVPVVCTPKGEKYFPAFTNVSELEKWKEVNYKEATIIKAGLDEYLDLLDHNKDHLGIVINPFNQSFLISKEMLLHLQEVRDEGEDKKHKTVISQFYN